MEHPIDKRLLQLGIKLPVAPTPAANYLPFVVSGNLLFIAGQAAVVDGKLAYTGRLGAELALAEGQAAARICAINLLAQAKAACKGDWNRLVRCVRVCGYINATAEFSAHPQVLDGASDLLVEVLGEAGKHVRTVMGASSLRNQSAMVVDAIFEIQS